MLLEDGELASKKAAHIRLENGYLRALIKQNSCTIQNTSDRRGCTSLNGECAQLPFFRFPCLHKPTFLDCPEKFSLIFEQHIKCGCPEKFSPLSSYSASNILGCPFYHAQEAVAAPPDEVQNHPEPEEMQPASSILVLKSFNGTCRRWNGNSYKWNR